MRTIALEVTPVPDADGIRLLEDRREVPMGFYQSPPFDVVVGADVGKGSHHLFAAVPATGEVVLDGPAANREPDLRAALGLALARGETVVVSDQPGPLSATLFACARDMGAAVRFMRCKAVRELSELHRGTPPRLSKKVPACHPGGSDENSTAA